jgi:hypothetical protein
MYEEIRIIIEIVSASICFILLWFMAKPYSLTRESRYLGLPLGFGFLGVSYVVVAILISIPGSFANELSWLQFLPRTFAFLFLAVTYYFSKKPSKRSPLIWNVTLSFLILVLVTLFIMVLINPQLGSPSYLGLSTYFRAFNLLCLFYISVYTLRRHVKNLKPTTIVIPIGFILLGMNQYSAIIWSVDRSYFAFWGTLVLRLTALVIFLFVSYKVFYSSNKGAER